MNVDIARAVPVIEVARRLGLEPERKNVWYFDPCAEAGDGIRLHMRALKVGFVEAVRDLAG